MSTTIESRSPHEPSDVLVAVPGTSANTVAAAFERGAAGTWSRAHATERAAALNWAADALSGAADEVASLVVREVGRPITEARQELTRGVNILREQGKQARELHTATRSVTLSPSVA